MATLTPIETYLTAEDFVGLSEFARIRSMESKLAQWYVTRAHIRVSQWAPFQVQTVGSPEEAAMLTEMQLAVFLIAERIAMANPAVPMAAAGISSESTGHSTVSRAPGGGNSGKSVEAEIIPPEAEQILLRWQVPGGEDPYSPIRTRVFDEPGAVASEDPNEKVVIAEDFELLSPTLTSRRNSI